MLENVMSKSLMMGLPGASCVALGQGVELLCGALEKSIVCIEGEGLVELGG
jgi:hypothetical protein